MKKQDFKPLQPADHGLFMSFTDPGSESCERAWANLLLYCDTYCWQTAQINDNLWVASFAENYLFFPWGKTPEPELLQQEMRDFQALTQECDVVCGDVPPTYLQIYPQLEEYFVVESDPGEADYLYDLDKLVNFRGARLRKKHNQLRQFERNYANLYKFRDIEYNDLEAVYAFAADLSSEVWQSESGEEEKLAMQRLFELWRDPAVALGGVLLEVENNIAGFSIYSRLSRDIADIHFEKSDRSCTGSGIAVTCAAAGKLLQCGCKMMNREQDLNIAGLRRAKEALDPDHLYYRISLKLRK